MFESDLDSKSMGADQPDEHWFYNILQQILGYNHL